MEPIQKETQIFKFIAQGLHYGMFFFINGDRTEYALIVMGINDRMSAVVENYQKRTKREMIAFLEGAMKGQELLPEFSTERINEVKFLGMNNMIEAIEGFEEGKAVQAVRKMYAVRLLRAVFGHKVG